jgi:secreted trypsin-like serine protease
MQKFTFALTSLVTALTLTHCVGVDADEVVYESKSSTFPIVGGSTANPNDWPWIVSLRSSSNAHTCGGSLIAPDWVLTAAHCPSPANVRVGPTASTAVSRNVLKRIVHPGYNATTGENDVALIQLSQSVSGVEAVFLNLDSGFPYAIPLVEATQPVLANINVAGWGATTEEGIGSATLLAAMLPTVTNNSCASAYNPYPNVGVVFASNLCAGYQHGGVDTCQGDSGGPLTFSFGRPLLAGVTSWGLGCARPGLPGVYGRVSSYTGWITQHVTSAGTFSPTALIVVITSG